MAWRPLGAVHPKALSEARIQAHYAVQRVSAPATVLINATPDWSYTALTWNETHRALVSHILPSGTVLGLRLPDLTIIEIHDQAVVHEYDLAGRSHTDIDLYLAVHLEAFGLKSADLSNVTYADMPDHVVAQCGHYDPNGLASEFEELANWFGNASAVLEIVREELATATPGPSPVYCWPHHFDIATLVMFDAGDPEQARSIGIGMSPGDRSYDQPYYYVNPWPPISTDDLPAIPEPGHWHTAGFVGAVATGEHILAQA
ncbi:MAG: hypothetical protein AAFY56_19530, partial [Pseudomonadota bacterium]